VDLPIRQLPERLCRILHQIRSSAFPHAETHEHWNDEVVALFVAHEYESFRDVVREFGEAFYGFRARGIEASDVDREVALEVGDVEREWVCAVALRAGICCGMRRAISRLVLEDDSKLNSGSLGRNNLRVLEGMLGRAPLYTTTFGGVPKCAFTFAKTSGTTAGLVRSALTFRYPSRRGPSSTLRPVATTW